MKLRLGQSLISAVDATAMIVVRCPEVEVSVTCGGQEMLAETPPAVLPTGAPAPAAVGVLMGKRYVADEVGLELLCVRPGPYPVEVNGVPVVQKNAKPLPASD
jgi:hypothetical protein